MVSNIKYSGLAQQLISYQNEGKKIRVGLVGCGEMGTDLLCRISLMQGIEVVQIVSRTIKNIYKAAKIAYQTDRFLSECENIEQVKKAMSLHHIAISQDLELIYNNDQIDVVVDATGHPEIGAKVAYNAIMSQKHVISMNVEADVAIGSYLTKIAHDNNVIYSLGAGDEPSACMELINFIAAMGHKVVAVGKGKNNPLIFDATPDQYEEEAQKRNMNPRMLVEFIDGSKTMVEMAAIANATGLSLDVDGMHGPNAQLDKLTQVFSHKRDGGILDKIGVVDYTIGKNVAPGVFAIAYIDHPRLRERMNDLKLGKGPYYCFYRPYHLTAMEVPLSCARAVLDNKADMQALSFMRSVEVCAVAKKNLKKGDILDFVGLYTYRAYTVNYKTAMEKNAIPCALLEGAKVIKDIKKGELFNYDNCTIKPDLFIAQLRKEQDDMIKRIAK